MDIISCIIQLIVLGFLVVWAVWKTEKTRLPQILAGAFGCYFLGTVFWTLHFFIRNDWPRGFSAADLSYIGFYCFFITAAMDLKAMRTDGERARARAKRNRLAALAASAVVLAFHTAYVLLAGGLVNNILYCIPLSFLLYHALSGFIAGGAYRRYHAAVLTTFTLELIILLVSSFGFDTLYYVFTYIQMAVWFFVVFAAKNGCTNRAWGKTPKEARV